MIYAFLMVSKAWVRRLTWRFSSAFSLFYDIGMVYRRSMPSGGRLCQSQHTLVPGIIQYRTPTTMPVSLVLRKRALRTQSEIYVKTRSPDVVILKLV